jgi:assimilatory nitrate reductase catalytic subunit
MPDEVKTTCPYCGVGCGVIASVADNGKVGIKGDPDHPSNFGRLCSKGAALGDTMDLPGRLLHPVINGKRVSWDNAMDFIAEGFSKIIEHYGKDAVAFYVSGQLLSEDYYVANKLMKGFIGSGNIDTNSRLCMSSSVAGHKRAFGADSVPCSYEDLEQADLITLVGSNTAWCHPVLYQRIQQARKNRPSLKVVVIDPRRTATCAISDLHIALAPGSDIALFQALLVYLAQHDALDSAFINDKTEGFNAMLAAIQVGEDPVSTAAQSCGVPVADIAAFFELFLGNEKCITVYSQGVNQWSYGTDKVNAIINCHLATGRIGKPGMGPFSFTGQPNAMGGREVGGLANQLAAHMDFNEEDIQRVATFWDSPGIAQQAGLKAVDMFNAVEQGKIRALWIMATNPVVSMPDSDQIRSALQKCDFVVVSDCVANTDTAQYANVLLPATTWGEKNGTVTNSERRISRQRAFVDAPGEARHDWQIIVDLATRLGFTTAFPYQHVADIFREHATLSGFDNAGRRDFDISRYADVTNNEYEQLIPRQWPVTETQPDGTARLFEDGRFFTASGRARFVKIKNGKPASTPSDDLPFSLNTGRIRDQWHTMTRTGAAARLNQHIVEPFVQIHPDDAQSIGIKDGMLARLTNNVASITVRAIVTEDQRPSSLFIPMHWNASNAQNSAVNRLVGRAVDPVSGQPEFKHSTVNISPYRPAWQGFILMDSDMNYNGTSYYTKCFGHGYWRYEIAGEHHNTDWLSLLRQHMPEDAEYLEFNDISQQRFRIAAIKGNRLVGCLFVSSDREVADHEWLGRLFESDILTADDRRSLLAGRPMNNRDDCGRTVCACFSIGEKTLVREINQQGLNSVEAIGERLKAGTNCGSCIPELNNLLLRIAS